MKPVVALVGRPNVGKSTLFNRLTRSRDALVDDMPGVTRDRHFGEAEWEGRRFILVDTGGFLSNDADAFASDIRTQVLQAVEAADHVVVVLDGKDGISYYDRDLVDLLRNCNRPVFYVVNKIDGERHEDRLHDFYALGIEAPYPVSGEHGYGVPDFLDALTREMPEEPEMAEEEEEDPETAMVRVAVVGRPNAGKSSLINRLLNEDRMVVSDVAGTTRDAIDSLVTFNRRPYLFIDTAGIRRKARIKQRIEKFSVLKSLKSLDRCDVALILIDASEGVTDQDVRVAGYAQERGCGVIFVLNKWDLVDKDEKSLRRFTEALHMEAKFLTFAPIISISALTGLRVRKIFNLINEVYRQYSSRVGTSEFNRIIEGATNRTEPSLYRGRRIKFYFGSQVAAKPPTFVLFSNAPEGVHFSYRRYLTNQIRQALGIDKSPIRLVLKERSGRIDFSEKKKKRTQEEIKKLQKERRKRKRRNR